MQVSASLIQHLRQVNGHPLSNHRLTGVGGGDINAAYRLQADGVDWFIKLNRASLLGMFEAEAAGLRELDSLQQVRVPRVVLYGTRENQAYLVLEYIELGALRGDSAARFGQQLANLHRQPRDFFGWPIDNTIGSTPQHNTRHADWPTFWRQQRLGKQLEFAADNGFTGALQDKGRKLLEQIPAFFTTYQPQPALLHGDLWGGNAASDKQDNPVMFDPACYYGDRETDIAMTELFGGFGQDFQAAYRHEYPLDPGYQTRKTLYNLYHILNHLNLFGGGYLGQANSMIERLLSELN
ncbi:fructosamine kinase family protein [Methylomonas sp. LL1]|uniref:fructosamine kinase family protein n=1 Tax=Methylomonas sp. LL1 TaxID=2785785 RepID=UPI0018C4021D|nr:fructosamine kinase family protein [Methylomonas sp. LL1]QPK65172.1 fructosamine kinase family protein [Methylomonas sp. LL1]